MRSSFFARVGDAGFDPFAQDLAFKLSKHRDVTVRDRKPDRALESSQGGARFKGVWRGIDFSLNYFFTFGDTGVKVRQDLSQVIPGPTASGCVFH